MSVLDWIAFAAAIGTVPFLIWIISRGRVDREAEDAAREHFDRTGRWPDEAP